MSNMFCFQCQEAAKGTGCDTFGVCGKSPEVSNLLDELIRELKEVSFLIMEVKKGNYDLKCPNKHNPNARDFIIDGLFTSITNANFDDEIIKEKIENARKIKSHVIEELIKKGVDVNAFPINGNAGVLATEYEDRRAHV